MQQGCFRSRAGEAHFTLLRMVPFASDIMASSLRAGQWVRGMRDRYELTRKLHDQVWVARLVPTSLCSKQRDQGLLTQRASSSLNHRQVVLKYDLDHRLLREYEVLQRFRRNLYIRNLIDVGGEPLFLVLEELQSDALTASGKSPLPKKDIKFIAYEILSALTALHAQGIAHTGNTVHF